MSEKGTLFFFTGLSGAGKTTLGIEFYQRLKAQKNNVVFFDGDTMRATVGDGIGYTDEERLRGALVRQFPLMKLLTDQGINIVYCAICMYSEVRNWARENIENYKEIYVRVSKETLIRRDQKGRYSAGAKNMVGVDLPFDEPKVPDFVIDNDGEKTPEELVLNLMCSLGLD